MTEAELLAEVIRLCREMGLLYHHCARSTYCEAAPGLPDLVIAGTHGVIFAELKSAEGETDAGQDLWAWTLSKIDDGVSFGQLVSYRLWRPADLEYGVTIRDWLERIR